MQDYIIDPIDSNPTHTYIDYSNYTQFLTSPLNVQSTGFSECYISQASVIHSWYNINDNNKTISINVNGTGYSFDLPIGHYTVSSLRTQMESSLFTATTYVFTVTYSSLLSRFTFSTTVTFYFKTTAMSQYTLDVFGFYKGIPEVSILNGTSYVLSTQRIPQLTLTQIFVKFSFNDSYNSPIRTNDNNYSLLIPVVSPYGFNVFYKPDTKFKITSFPDSTLVNKIKVEFYDQYNNRLDLNGGFNSFNFTFSSPIEYF